MFVFVCFLGAVFLCSVNVPGGDAVVVTVDPIDGDDSECLSAATLLDPSLLSNESSTSATKPCRTINYALHGPLNNSDSSSVSSPPPLENVLIRLEGGMHRLTSAVSLINASNVTFEAVSWGQASVRCTDFPNYASNYYENDMTYDNLFARNVTGLSFVGIEFVQCGPGPSNLFIRHSNDVFFSYCSFM